MSKLILFNMKEKIILTKSNEFFDYSDISLPGIEPVLFTGHDSNYGTAILSDDFLGSHNSFTSEILPQCNLVPVRKYFLNSSLVSMELITKARQLAFWDYDHKYCGRCGSGTKAMINENAKKCSNCGYIVYPRLSPCVLAAVIRENKVLLGRSYHFPPGVYSLLAGFVEVGENCEHAVAREVLEESGIKIKNIRYFGSQSWPFPHSLMFAYLADYDDGDIVVDKEELEDVRWFSFESLRTCPDLLPAKGSLSRMLIDNLINNFFAR
jgi:NAD+ diphosphatase